MKYKSKFRGELAFCSNMYKCKITYKNLTFDSAEAAFQAEKCKYEVDRLQFVGMEPVKAKQVGKTVILRDDWKERRIAILYDILLCKFRQNMYLLNKLRQVEDHELTEFNVYHDNFWGHCICPGCENKEHHNILGKLLRKVKNELSMVE